MNVRHASHVIDCHELSYRRGERAAIIGVGILQVRAHVEKPCLRVR
jgi:hypothetical protein